MAETLGNRIKSLRIQNNLTQLELANRLDIDRSYIAKLESGNRGSNVSTSILKSLASIFDVPIATLLQ
jgi:transcriptional regulator with XRE-family HTH domain